MANIVSNCTMCELRWSAGTNQCENTLAFTWSGGRPTQQDLLALATQVGGGIGFWFRRAMSDQIVFREVYCTNIDIPNGEQATYVFPNNTRGQRAGFQLALSEAASIVRRTGRRGRKFHGANRVSGFIETDVDGNSLGQGLMALLGDIAINLLVSYVGGRFLPAVASRTGGFATALTSALVPDSDVDSQKTRLNRHGT